MPYTRKDLTGQSFGELVVLGYAGNNHKKHRTWECRCSCGNVVIVATYELSQGVKVSCGCNNGDRTKLYYTYNNIVDRLNNPKHKQYKDYGGRGIGIDPVWASRPEGFINFCEWALTSGYAEGLTIDRKDVNGDYSPDNCRWATMKEQCENRRSTRLITYNGETKSAKAWSIHLGGSADVVIQRLKAGWSEEEAVSAPIETDKRRGVYITYGGETLSVADWSRRLGGGRGLVSSRLYQGWTEEEAITTMKGQRRPKKKRE